MKYRRNVLTLIIFFALPVLLFHFQNCAPSSSTSAMSSTGSGGHARLIEDLNKAQIQFVSESAEIQDEALAVDIAGLCNRDHNGAGLRWSVWAGQNTSRPLAQGD